MEQLLLLALLRSALYALVALGFTLLFGVAGVLNLAHGAFLMTSAYVAYTAFALAGVPLGLSLALGVLSTTLLAAGLYRGIVHRVQRSPVLTLIVTLAIALALQELAALIFGLPAKSLPPPVPGNVRLLDLTIPNVHWTAFGLSWLAIGALGLFLNFTRLGKAIRATAMSRAGAQLVGIDVERVYTLTWALSGGLAGLAGLFFAYPGGVAPRMWVDPLVIAFAVVILGGLGSLLGSLAAAYLIGFVETFTFYAPQFGVPLGAAWVGIPSLLLTILILIVRPRGLFGTR
jgi:branched-chain amino acid transport system permease protein